MNRYAITIEAEYIVYGESVEDARSKLSDFLKKKVNVTGCIELQPIEHEPITEIVYISPVNQRKP